MRLKPLMIAVLSLFITVLAIPPLAFSQAGQSEGKSQKPRNVVIIIPDDQGMDAGVYGNDAIKTPNIDQLAAEGTQFMKGFATVSSCSPSRSVILTGLQTHTNGMYGLAHDIHNFHLVDGVQTLPTLLKQAGYTTALVGKYHLKPESAFAFDAELVPEQAGIRDVSVMAKEAGKFMAETGDQPFLLVMGYSDPHRAPQNFGNTQKWPDVPRVTYEPDEVEVPAHLPDLPAVREDLAEHYESVSRLDTGVGLLLDEIKATGHEDDTLVIYVSDNGRPFPGAKTLLHDDGIHLPLIIRSPEQRERGVKNNAMVSWVDIFPTVLDWAGAPAPEGYQLPGRSLLPILEQENPDGWDRVFASHTFHEINRYYPMRAVRTHEYKYILNLEHQLTFPISGDVEESPSWAAIMANPEVGVGKWPLETYLNRPEEELYDLTKDPEETRNVANDPAYAEIKKALRAELDAYRAQTRDPWLPGQTSAHGHMTH